MATVAEPASTAILAARLPEEIVAAETVPGPVHARVLFQAAHNRLPGSEARQFRRLLDAHRSLLHARNAEVERTIRDHAGNVKFKLRFGDGVAVETVVLADPGSGSGRRQPRRTLCLSTQVGCSMGCRFCRTGQLGLHRNLTVEEIVGQYLAARERVGPLSNVVFMGMGEPLLNTEAVFAAARVFAHPQGPEIPFKRITISTCGVPAGIDRLASESFLGQLPGARPRLAVSLVTADPMRRARLMPGATRLAGGTATARAAAAATAEAAAPTADAAAATAALENLRAAVARYLERTGRPVTFEVPLLGGVNDNGEDAAAVCRLLNSLPRRDRCDVNLIPWNRVDGVPFEPPTDTAVSAFAARILAGGYPVTGRFPRGRSIAAACGQLGQSVSPGSHRRQP
ncbi:MAG: radical SAM protein [Spirochaetia bacterium]